MTIRFDGADLSHYQATIDWPLLRASSWWVATKATQGNAYVDPTFSAHRAEMAKGFTHRGLYHWLSPGVDVAAQVAHFLATIGPLQRGEFVMLDAEEGGITEPQVASWCEGVEALTHRPASVYSGAYVASGTVWQSKRVRTSAYGPRPMHLAAYTTEQKALALPGVAANPWSAWQYSSNGPVPGVTGRCDMNRVDLRAHYDLAAGLVGPTPVPTPPTEDDMADFYFTDGTPSTWMLMPDGTKRGLGYPVEYGLRGVGSAAAPIHTLTPAEVAQIPDYVPPGAIVVPPLTGHLVADLGAGGHITGSVG